MKVIFLGVQGSGKSTQAHQLAEYLEVPYIEMGQLFRIRASDKDPDAQTIKEALDRGQLVPDEIAVNTVKNRLSQKDCQRGYVLDGYPRNNAQLKGLPKEIDQVFYVKVPDKEAIKRLLGRGRHDDKLELIKNRISWHHKETEPLLAGFKSEGILTEIDGRKSIEEVHRDIITKIKHGPNKN